MLAWLTMECYQHLTALTPSGKRVRLCLELSGDLTGHSARGPTNTSSMVTVSAIIMTSLLGCGERVPKSKISNDVNAYNLVFYPENRCLLSSCSQDKAPSGACDDPHVAVSCCALRCLPQDASVSLLRVWCRGHCAHHTGLHHYLKVSMLATPNASFIALLLA